MPQSQEFLIFDYSNGLGDHRGLVELQSRSEGEVPLADRTAALRRLVQVEQSLLGIGLKRYPKIRFTIAEMITHGPPQALD